RFARRPARSHPYHSSKPPAGVIRLGAVVVDEGPAVAVVAEEGAAVVAEVGWGLEPTGGLLVEGAERLQGVVLGLGQQFDPHGGGQVEGGVDGFVLPARLQAGAVVAEAPAAGGGLGGAVVEEALAGLAVRPDDDVRLAAGPFHLVQRPEFVRRGRLQ